MGDDKKQKEVKMVLDGDYQPWEAYGGASIQAKRAKSRTDRKANFKKRLAKRRAKAKKARRRK